MAAASSIHNASRRSRDGRSRDIAVSFEFFPPKTDEMDRALWDAIERLAPLGPSFVSVTYGAGGSTRERTHATVSRIIRETQIAPAAHLTLRGGEHDRHQRCRARLLGCRRPPHRGVARRPSGRNWHRFRSAREGVTRIHPSSLLDCEDSEISRFLSPLILRAIRRVHRSTLISMCLQAKVDAGATRAITQFFFENDLYLRFLDKARARGIQIPIVPGIVPVENFQADGRVRTEDRRHRAAMACRALRWAGKRPCDASLDWRGCRRRAGA